MDRQNQIEGAVQTRMILKHHRKIISSRRLLYMFWGLIIAKCLLVEWAVQYYRMPFNSLYIWVPTLLFIVVTTLVYGKVILNEMFNRPLAGRLISAIWMGCLSGGGLIGVAGTASGHLDPFLLPALFAVILGMAYFIHNAIDSRILFTVAAGGWWLGGLWLFYHPGLDALVGLALMIVCFQVLPTALLYLPVFGRGYQ